MANQSIWRCFSGIIADSCKQLGFGFKLHVAFNADSWQILVDNFGGRVTALACGNELDLHGVPHEFAAELVHKTLPIVEGKNIRTIATSVTSSDWANYLDRLSKAV